MKEIDLKVLQQLIQSELEILNIKYIFIFILVNLIIALANWLIQKNIKSLENKIYMRKVREDKRISIIEEIYKELVSYTYILDKKEIQLKIKSLSELEKRIASNKLYIDYKMNSKITNFIDYIKDIMADFRKKDFKKEKTLLNEIEKQFNK